MPAIEYKKIQPKTRLQWRTWLEKNHASSPGIWLTYYKKETGKPRILISDAVEEALCFGWIDSLHKKLDDEKNILKFTPRKPKSVWSGVNKARIEKLIAAKKMMPAGTACIAAAKKNGSWDALTASDAAAASNQLPADLDKAFAKHKKAKANFQQFALSIRKLFLSWIDSAKRPETRAKRIHQTVLMAQANKKPGITGFKL